MENWIVCLGEENSDHEKKQCVEKNRMGRFDLYIFYPDGFDTYVMEFMGQMEKWQISVLSAVAGIR